MAQRFKIGDRVSWNSEAGRVRGKIVRVHTKDVDYKGYVHHASKAEPQYEIKSEKTAHIALHKGKALRRLGESMIRKSRYRFPACAKPWQQPIFSWDASAGEGRSEKIMLKNKLKRNDLAAFSVYRRLGRAY